MEKLANDQSGSSVSLSSDGSTVAIGATKNDGNGSDAGHVRIYETILGCTDPLACNYDPLANVDDGSCIYTSSSSVTTTSCDSLLWNGVTYDTSGVIYLCYNKFSWL
jgi:hypothetical protein